jgi:hypothetical protein
MALGIALIVWQSPGGQHSMQLAYVDRVVGDVLIDGQAASSGDPLGTSSVIETMAGGRIAVSLANGQSMRVDNASRLLMDSADQLRLYSGGVYIDSGPAAADAHVAVITSHGVATDVGTQFQVRMERGHLRVAVREGLVELERPGNPVLEIDSGNLVDVSRTGDHSTVPVSGNDSLWSWVTSVSPVFDIEGATLEEYLGWYAREAGLALEWDSPASHHNAAQTRLSGSIRDMSLEEGFQLVRRIAPFDARVASSTLHVRVD